MNSNLQKLCMLLASIMVSVALNAQTVTKTFDKTPLKAVLEEVESQTGFMFMYKNDDMNQAKPITASFKNASVTAVLDKVLGSDYSYSIKDKIVTIKKADRPVTANINDAAGETVTQAAPANPVIPISGKVVDAQGEPVIGAVITVPGRRDLGGATTDIDGLFTFKAPVGSTLQISCIGYQAVDKVVDASGSWDIVLGEDSEMIEETVVVGYGVQKKESVVGAISQVNSETLVNTGQTNITQALSGKVSGLYSYQTSGQPGSDDATFYLRGYSSWNGSAPLVMVDGVEREFNNLDPNEVETISVLKDASATAVFGAKGANGVILVTTKTGKRGAPKTHLSVNFGLESPTMLPEVYDAETILRAHNEGLKNDGMYGGQHSEEQIANYKSGTNPLRYPDNNWYDLMIRDFTPSTNVSYGVSGGSERVRYYVNLGYKYEGSIVKNLPGMTRNFNTNRINYRSNIDFDVTKTTMVSVKFGGYTRINQRPGADASALFTGLYNASTTQYPAYFPEDVMLQYPDSDYPGLVEFRRAGKGDSGVYYTHPYNLVADGDFSQTTTVNLNTDLEVNQKLDFITPGLYINGKVSYSTLFKRNSQSAAMSYPTYYLDWTAIDSGEGNPWIASSASTEVYVQEPYKISKDNKPTSTHYTFYWETSAHYDKSFGDHNLSAMALMYQRNDVLQAAFPSRTESYVGRINYNYKNKYLLETNLGITGSEQFSPKNRYGIFPSVAIGYAMSKEPWWQEAMPWWSTFKIRYSDGFVGSDAASAQWLYFSAYDRDGSFIKEAAAANETARWEKAHKRNLGFEMGWFKDNLLLNVELFNEDRTDILITPLTTMFVVADYKDINAGAIKKHGFEVELKYRNTTGGGLYYEVGGMFGYNENRITAYQDPAYAPDYQKRVGKALGSSAIGESLVDDRFFGTIDQKHGYPGGNDSQAAGRNYKFLDYNGDGDINNDDRHPIHGSLIPPVTYSGNIALAYKNFSFDASVVGASGKYIGIEDVYYIEFYKGDYLLHANSMNYWTPTNNSANHAAISVNSAAIAKFGRTDAIGSNCDVLDVLWLKANYLKINNVRFAYKLKNSRLIDRLGIDGLTVTLTGNNLYTFSKVKDADPEIMDLQNSYYPFMRSIKLGVNIDF